MRPLSGSENDLAVRYVSISTGWRSSQSDDGRVGRSAVETTKRYAFHDVRGHQSIDTNTLSEAVR